MKKYKIYHSAIFDKKLDYLSKDLKDRVDKIENQLVDNPYMGKPLGVSWFREKKLNKHRTYYLIYEDLLSLYMINISEKSDQQKVINTIRLFLEKYRNEIEEIEEIVKK